MKNCYLLCFWTIGGLCCAEAIEALLRRRRALVYTDPRGSETKVQVLFGLGLPMEGEVSMTLGYVIKCNYNLPYNSSQLSLAADASRQQPSRWSLYRLLESSLGRACLLRTVCEAAAAPFVPWGRRGGPSSLLGELLHALLTPSLTGEEYEIYADRQYRAAEARGRSAEGCRRFRDDCPRSPLDYFTEVLQF